MLKAAQRTPVRRPRPRTALRFARVSSPLGPTVVRLLISWRFAPPSFVEKRASGPVDLDAIRHTLDSLVVTRKLSMAITLTCTGCGKSYQLKDELAGRKVRCPGCQSVQVVPGGLDRMTIYGSAPMQAMSVRYGLHAAFNHDKFLLRQKLMTDRLEVRRLGRPAAADPVHRAAAHFWRNLLAAFAAAICLPRRRHSVVRHRALGIGQMLDQDVVGGRSRRPVPDRHDRPDVRGRDRPVAQAAHQLLRR